VKHSFPDQALRSQTPGVTRFATSGRTLGEAPADDAVDGGFGEGGRDDLAMIPALRIVRDRGGIVPDVGDQPSCHLDQPRQAGIAAGQGGDILSQRAGAAQGLTGVAVP
jgi:hypothetical protein